MSWCLEFTDCLGFGVRVDCILPNPSGLWETKGFDGLDHPYGWTVVDTTSMYSK